MASVRKVIEKSHNDGHWREWSTTQHSGDNDDETMIQLSLTIGPFSPFLSDYLI